MVGRAQAPVSGLGGAGECGVCVGAIFVVRDAGEVFRGRADIELNKRGREQAQALAAAVKDIQIDAVYSSPLRRAVETAEVMAESHDIPVEIEQGFIDFDYGVPQ